MTTLMESSNDHSLSLVLEVHCNRQSTFALGVVVVAVHHRRQYYYFDGEKSKKVVEEKRKTATVTGKEFGVDAHGTRLVGGEKINLLGTLLDSSPGPGAGEQTL